MNDALQHVGYITLPEHAGSGGFDHAAIHSATGRVYVAHTANNAVDVLDTTAGRHLFSIGDLPGVAGVLVSDESQLVVTSNRAENTIGIFALGPDPRVVKIAVGVRPNGLAYDPKRGLILVANVGDPAIPNSHMLSIVGVDGHAVLAEIRVPGRTRWAVYDPEAEAFYVNIAEPAEIVVVEPRDPYRIARTYAIPAAGPHGLDLDPISQRLFCACDAKTLVTLEARSGKIVSQRGLSGVPDVVFFNPRHKHLYVAVGDPGVIDVFDTETMQRLGSVATEKGAHTLAFAPKEDQVLAFLPGTHRAAIYQERQS
jgi:DNA-binding beta-propeller fold protein YncE